MKKSLIITALAATSTMFGTGIPGVGIWQTVATPIGTTPTVTNEVITSSTTTVAGNAYWNNGSTDDEKTGNPGNVSPGVGNNTLCYNIGCYLTGVGAWAGSPAIQGALPSPLLDTPVYVGNDNGTAISDLSFVGQGVAPGTQMLAQVAGFDDNNWLGWYDSTPGKVTSAASLTAANRGILWDVIYTGQQSPGAISNFNPTNNFGLFFFDSAVSGSPLLATDTTGILSAIHGDNLNVNGFKNPGAVFTQSQYNVADGNANQHFAVFAASAAAGGTLPADFWVGVEDKPFSVSDKDYNDMVVHLRVVPEPGYFLLLSLGLGGLGLAHRRLKKAA